MDTLKKCLCMSIPALMVFSFSVNAQDWTERERRMLSIIEALEERIDGLEQKSAGNAQIEERLETLEEAGDVAGDDFRVYWKEGIRLDSHNGRFKLKIGGRIQNDWGWFDDSGDLRKIFGDVEDGTEFRRARLYFSGTIYDRFEFKAQYDFAGGDADFKDVFMAVNKIPYVGQLKIGHFKEPFSIEELTSSKYITFMERSLPNVLSPSRNTGLMLSNHHFNDRFTWAVGVFRDSDAFGGSSDDGGYNVTARVTGLPWYAEEGRKLLHLGLAYSRRNPDGRVRFRQRPEAHLVPSRYIDTRFLRVDSEDRYNAELAFVYGPFSLQGEYTLLSADTVFGSDRDFEGYYVQASWFLTGEHRRYKTSTAAFDRVKPKRNVGRGENEGPGAWELALRYSNLDLDDGLIGGGEEDNITAAVNWYLNPNVRVMFNYIRADIHHLFYDGELDILQTRFQIDF